MWLGIKFETWGFIFGLVGVAAFVLAIPLAVAANLLTPRLRNWWADRSTRSARARAAALKSELENYEQNYQLVDPPLLLILRAALVIVGIACIAVCSLACAFTPLFWMAWDYPSPEPHHRAFVVISAAVTYLTLIPAYLFGLRTINQLDRYGRQHSARYRDNLRHSIAKLESHQDR
jgi:MFS family permease